jgi:ABC-type transporter Mla subunit MlaD
MTSWPHKRQGGVSATCGSRLGLSRSASDLQRPRIIEANRAKPRRTMDTLSRFETLTNRRVQIQERAERLVSDLRRLVHLLEYNIDNEEERTGIFDRANSNYSVTARQLRARRDNLAATISKLEGLPAPTL